MNKKISTFISIFVVMFLLASSVSAVFTDVPDTHPDKAAIDYCVKNEFMKGYGNGLFKPDGNITRGEFITVWARTFRGRQHSFDDATKTKNEVDNAIVLMYGMGYVNGVSKTEFSIYDNITREEVAKIVENTYLIGIDGNDQYENYTDSDKISSWARNAVSVCYQKGIFEGIATTKFDPQTPMTRSEICAVITKLLKTESMMYDIVVGDLVGGQITANKTKAAAGDTITLNVTPSSKRMLVEGSLKYNSTAITGTSFVMPASDVTITAEFMPYLESIEVTEYPTKFLYASGDKLNLAGLEVTATYSDDTTKKVSGYTTNPQNDTTLNGEEGTDITVTVSYTEDGITKTDTFIVTISGVTP